MLSFMAGITKIGEGFDGDQNLPLDIPYTQIADWLLSRRKLPQKFRVQLKDIRKEFSEFLETNSSFFSTNYPKISSLIDTHHQLHLDPDYILFSKISDIFTQNLPTTLSADHKKINNQITKLRKNFEYSNLCIGDQADFIVLATTRLLPAQKDEVRRLQKSSDECSKKEHERSESARQFRQKFEKMCSDLAISSTGNIRQELCSLRFNKLPALLDSQLVQPAFGNTNQKDLYNKAIHYYRNWCNFVYDLKHGDEKEINTSQFLSSLEFLVNNGNVEIEQEMIDMGEKVTDKNKNKNNKSDESNSADDNAEPTLDLDIDWSALDLNDDSVGGDVDNAPVAEINWDITDFEVAEDGKDAKDDVVGDGIAWDIQQPVDLTSDKTDDEKRKRKLTWLEKLENRNNFLADLLELHGFLMQRASENQSGGAQSSFLLSLSLHFPKELITGIDQKFLVEALNSLAGIFRTMENDKVKNMLELSFSNMFLDRLNSELQKVLELEISMRSAMLEMETKREGIDALLAVERPKVKLLQDMIKDSKENVQSRISSLYSSRKVNITQLPAL